MPGLGGTYSFGHYTATYDGNNVGETEGPKRLQFSPAGTPIFSDRWGQTVIDGIFGGGNAFALVVFKEWTAAVRAALWPFGSFGNIGVPGKRWTDLAKQMVFTALAGTPAASNGPTTITFPLAIPDPGNNVEVIFGNAERNVPVLFRLLPDASGNLWT